MWELINVPILSIDFDEGFSRDAGAAVGGLSTGVFGRVDP